MELKKENEFAVKIMSQIAQMFDEDADCDNHITNEELQEYTTEFIHALANIAPSMYYDRLTGDKNDLVGFNHIANRLCFQFGKSVDNEEEG